MYGGGGAGAGEVELTRRPRPRGRSGDFDLFTDAVPCPGDGVRFMLRRSEPVVAFFEVMYAAVAVAMPLFGRN
jgi:hypothetical protein